MLIVDVEEMQSTNMNLQIDACGRPLSFLLCHGRVNDGGSRMRLLTPSFLEERAYTYTSSYSCAYTKIPVEPHDYSFC